MSPAPFDVARGSAFRPSDRTALAYVSRDGALALYNDYATHRSTLVHEPMLRAEDLEVRARWRGAAPGPRTVSVGGRVRGYGVFTFPYGPVAMGTAETGAFDLVTYGERVLELVPTVGYKDRGIERAVVGRTVEDAALWVERRAGVFALAHVSAFLAAAEAAAGRSVPERELWRRALAQELQRIQAHLRLLARIADGASQNVGAAQVHALEEELLRAISRCFGHRWGFGALLPAHPPDRLDRNGRAELADRLGRISRGFSGLWETFLASRTFIDRIQGTGTVPAAESVRWAAVGPTLRASSIAWDDRLRQPSVPYTDLFVPLATETNGDALARVLVRQEEIRASFLMLEQMLERWEGVGAGEVPPSPGIAPSRGIARVEAPNGDLVYDVIIADGRVASLQSRSPSEANWSVMALSLRGAVFTDFVFSLESFGSSFAETDG
ncbi:MAG: hypothetical protein LVQ64_02635 [Thermoplasmatales archaeon]|nr:hypothetical protein [Thermoplasmatales archaeon]